MASGTEGTKKPSEEKKSSGTDKTKKKSKRSRGSTRRLFSKKTEMFLTTILQDVMEQILRDAKKIAYRAGKGQLSVSDVETALRRLCGPYYRPKLVSKSNDTKQATKTSQDEKNTSDKSDECNTKYAGKDKSDKGGASATDVNNGNNDENPEDIKVERSEKS